MKRGDTYRVPSPEHLSAEIGQSVFGMGTEGDNGLTESFIHFCAIGDALESDVEAAYQRFYGNFIAARGGVLVTWSDDLPTCFERFTAQVRVPLEIAPYDDASGALRMIDISRAPVPADKSAVFIEDVEIERFNLFASKSHPTLPGVEVTTGIEYDPAKYPDVYEQAYCYFNTWEDGIRVRFDLGNKDFGWPVACREVFHETCRSFSVDHRANWSLVGIRHLRHPSHCRHLPLPRQP